MYLIIYWYVSIHISIYGIILKDLISLTELIAMEHNFFEPELHFESAGDVSIQQKWKAISAPTTLSDNGGGCFDCNICLESAHEPVVTFCGHLYCWPCIYQWLHVQISEDESDPVQTCPVCKANISQASLVPLYGRGRSPSDSNGKKPNSGLVIPNRPSPCGLNTLISTTTATSHSTQQLHPNYFQSQAQSESFHHQQYFPHPYGGHAANASTYLGGTAATATASDFSPTIGMFGEMVYARMFGSSYTSLYPYPASYPPAGISSTPRMRRQEMELDKSLNRLSIFLFFCIMLCLLVFWSCSFCIVVGRCEIMCSIWYTFCTIPLEIHFCLYSLCYIFWFDLLLLLEMDVILSFVKNTPIPLPLRFIIFFFFYKKFIIIIVLERKTHATGKENLVPRFSLELNTLILSYRILLLLVGRCFSVVLIFFNNF